jgi:hypothetical protein
MRAAKAEAIVTESNLSKQSTEVLESHYKDSL